VFSLSFFLLEFFITEKKKECFHEIFSFVLNVEKFLHLQSKLLIISIFTATVLAVARSWTPISRWLGRPNWWPPLMGLTLVVPWVVLAELQRDAGWAGATAARAGFNPFTDLTAGSAGSWSCVIIRAIGLIAVVPLIEELFLRGFLMRYVIREDFWTVPFGMLTFPAAAACLFYAAASHPSECVAAVGWFAVITGIAAATRRPIDTILAHAATNLALGAYVLMTANWWLL
jgi:CAAX prenyl protease-like protein